MRKYTILSLFLSATLGTAYADTERATYSPSPSQEETTGLVGGIVLGGLAGGPPGIVFGAAIGAFMGDGWHAKRRVGDLQAGIYAARLEADMVREQNAILHQEYQIVRQQLDNLSPAAARYQDAGLNQLATTPCCDNTVLSLYFRSGSAHIEPHLGEQLASLARLARQMPTALIEITGFADRTGNAEQNLALSRQRSESVKHFLMQEGITDSAIATIAYGDTRPLQATQSLESDFFDRRVLVRLRDSSQQLLSRSPNGN